MYQPAGLIQTQHEIHVLYGLTSGTFNQIVNGRHEDQAPIVLVHNVANITAIGTLDIEGIRGRPTPQSDERSARVKAFKAFLYLLNSHAATGLSINSGLHAPGHGK